MVSPSGFLTTSTGSEADGGLWPRGRGDLLLTTWWLAHDSAGVEVGSR